MPGAELISVGDRADPRRPDIGLDVVRLPWLGARDRWTATLTWLRGLDQIDPGPVDLVVSLEAHSVTTAQAHKVARRLGVPHAVTSAICLRHDPLSWAAPPWSIWSRRMITRADAFLCQTKLARDVLVQRGAPANRTFAGLPGVDTNLFKPPNRRVSEPVVTYVGDLRHDKGISDVVKAADRAQPGIGADFRLVVLGDGPLRTELEQQARTRPWLDVRGRVTREEAADTLQRSRSFVLAPFQRPLWCEQLGFASIEAMACGLPIVITRSGATPEVVPAHNVLVPEHDIEGLAQGLVRSLTAEGEEWGRLNRAHVMDHYDLETQAGRVHDFLSTVMRH